MRDALNQFGSARKLFHAGTHRTRSPQQTLDALLPRIWDFGITRLADVTGLDVIGMPVYMAVRPNSRSISVSQGKGIDRAAAKASALMESLETWHAEHTELPIQYESYAALRRSAEVVDVTRLPLRRGAVLDPSSPMLWVTGYDLIRSYPIWVPYECVSMNFVKPNRLGTSFPASSNGLASGNHILEAITHGLCEVVERDALALWEARGGFECSDPQVDLSSIDDRGISSLLQQLHDAEIAVNVMDLTADTGVPTFMCTLSEADPLQPRWTIKGLFGGYGSHLDPLVALTRAISEAVQSRLTHIAASRDDMFHYDTQAHPDDIRASRGLFARRSAPFEHTDLSADRFEDDIDVILRNLQAVGVDSVVVVDLTRPGIDIPVVKTIVPGLEGSPHSTDYRPGGRATSVGAKA